MRALLEWLSQHVEPYLSFRFVLWMVFTAMTVQALLATVFWLRDLSKVPVAATPREQQIRRLLTLWMKIAILRTLSWRKLREHFALKVQILALLLLAIALNYVIVTRS
jgi:uncharacterized protein involved in cysteine biosynthesis